MFLNTDYITPAELTGYARAALKDLPDNQFALASFLPNRDVDDLEYRFVRGGEGLVEAATYRSYDTEAPISSRPGLTRVAGELPPISRKIRMSEYDRLRQRKLDGAVAGQIERDSLRLIRQVAARIELARGEALADGKITLAENGLVATVDFGRAAGNTVTAGTAWTPSAGTPLTDLLAWRDAYIAANDGVEPGAILTSNTVINVMLRNEEFRNFAGNLIGGVPNLVTRSVLDQILSAYGLPPIVEYNVQMNVNGVTKRVIPADRVLLLPAATTPDNEDGTDLGATLWGTTAEALSQDYEIDETEAPGIVAGAYETKDPVALWTKASAISMPILANPNLSFSADVLA